MYIVTSEQMRRIDKFTISEIGIPAMVLMENAGRAAAEEIRRFVDERHIGTKPWIILIGKGNNGGDGIVAARHLLQHDIPVHLCYAVEPSMLSSDAAMQRNIAQKLKIPSSSYTPGTIDWSAYGGIIDALLGTGSKGKPKEPYASLIQEANDSRLPLISLDIPSGLDADTGEVYDPCVRADRTVTFAFAKVGIMQYPGAAYAGEVIAVPIGIPATVADHFEIKTKCSGNNTFRARFGYEWPLSRTADSHKGTYGHVLIYAGSKTYSGAGLLSVKAALRAGAGLVTWVVPESLLEPMMGHLPEAILAGVKDDGTGRGSVHSAEEIVKLAGRKQVLAVGPGIGRFDSDIEWLRIIWNQAESPLILDADALNILADADGLKSWPKRNFPTILTPHPGEMTRLTKRTSFDVQRDRVGLARAVAEEYQVIVVLKGARTVIAAPDGEVFINTTGNPGMAAGGSGDVLTGIIAGFAAQGLSPFAAAVIGAYVHGEAGDRAAAERSSPASLLAGDIIDAL